MQFEFDCLTFRMKLVCFYFSLSYLQTFTAAAFEIHVLDLDSMGAFCGLQCLEYQSDSSQSSFGELLLLC